MLNEKEFGARLRAARAFKGLTLEKVGDMTGMSPIAISNYEKGNSIPRVDTLYSLCECLGKSPDYFTNWQNDEPIQDHNSSRRTF